MGAMGALAFALSRRALTWRTLYDAPRRVGGPGAGTPRWPLVADRR